MVKNKKDESNIKHYATNKVPVVLNSYSVLDTCNFISKRINKFETIDYIYVANEKKNLLGILSIKALFKYPSKTRVDRIMEKGILTISPDTPQSKVADLALKHNLKALPIVKDDKFYGVILTSKISSILNKRLHKNILYAAGIHKNHLEYENTLEVPLFTTLLHRMPWLIVGLIGIIFAAGLISRFENLLNAHLILAFFIPAIVYMSDALGTQLQTLFIRDIAIIGNQIKWAKYLSRQIFVGFILSLCIAGVTFLIVSIFWKEYYISLVISFAMFITLIISSFTSLLVTYLFEFFGQDPALGSGPFATIVSDITSILVYFMVVSLML